MYFRQFKLTIGAGWFSPLQVIIRFNTPVTVNFCLVAYFRYGLDASYGRDVIDCVGIDNNRSMDYSFNLTHSENKDIFRRSLLFQNFVFYKKDYVI